MATTIYHGPNIWVGAPGIHTWWFYTGAWKPGHWLRASMNARHSTDSEGCHSYQGNVEILRQWTETRTIEKCGDFRNESVALVHWVQFRITHAGSPTQAFRPVIVLPRFVVHT
jgi:hypothetical protein